MEGNIIIQKYAIVLKFQKIDMRIQPWRYNSK